MTLQPGHEPHLQMKHQVGGTEGTKGFPLGVHRPQTDEDFVHRGAQACCS